MFRLIFNINQLFKFYPNQIHMLWFLLKSSRLLLKVERHNVISDFDGLEK